MTTELLNFKGRMKPIVETTIVFSKNNPSVFAAQDIIHYMQMAVYWFQGAADTLFAAQLQDNFDHGESNGIPLPDSPKDILIAPSVDQLNFIHDQLETLEKDAFTAIQAYGMEDRPKFWVNAGIQKLIEAKFSTVLAGLQYERLQSLGGANILNP